MKYLCIYQFLKYLSQQQRRRQPLLVPRPLRTCIWKSTEIRIGKSFFAKIWQVFATGVGEGGSRGGGAHREGVGEQRRRHRQPPHPLLAPTPRSSFKHSIQ